MAIVGLGQIGMGYDLSLDPNKCVYSHARAFQIHPEFELVGAVDSDSYKQERFKEFYGVAAFPDIKSMSAECRPDLVVVALPTENHYEAIKEVIKTLKPKIILCEKPLSYSLAQAKSMVEACEAAGIGLLVNYMRRADPAVLQIKSLIEAGKISPPIKGVVWYSKGFLHNGSHFFNLLEFWLGPFIASKSLDRGRRIGEADSEPDVRIEFRSGSVVFLSCWEEAFSHYTIELMCQTGRLRYEYGGEQVMWQSTCPDANFSGYEILNRNAEFIPNGMDKYQIHVVEQLAIALSGQPHTLCTGIQSFKTLEAMHLVINGD